jgi:DNA-binding MarR family transcriptional regulator
MEFMESVSLLESILIVHDHPNTAQYKTVQTASIHDTPPPEKPPNPLELLDGYLQVPNDLKLTETKPPVEQSLYLHSPFTTTAPFRKSRRTSRKQAREVLKWKAKEAKQDWKYLAQQPGWQLLSKDEKFLLMLAWPDRHFCLSYEEIADTLSLSIDAAKRQIKKWVEKKKLKKKKNYLKRHGKQTGIHKRNHYTCTKQQKKEIAKLVNLLFSDTEKTAPRKDSNKLEKYCQDKSATSNDKKVFEGSEKAYQNHLEERLAELEAEQEPLKPVISTIFELYGFKSHLATLCPHLRKKINEISLKRVVKVLKFIEKKVKNGFRLRSFWAFFRHALEKNLKCWLTKRADEYLEAIKDKSKMKGVDSQAVVEMITKIQEKTGMVASKRDLHGMLCYGAIYLKAYLKVVLFKSNLVPIRNWVGYAHFLAKKPIVELSNMYKSEEQMQSDLEAEDAVLRGVRNQRHASDWGKLIGDLEDGDRVFATGISGEIWD